MAVARPLNEQSPASAVSSFSGRSDATVSKGARFEKFLVQPKGVRSEIPCYLGASNAEKTHKLLQAFLTVHDVSKDLELLARGLTTRAAGVTMPDGSSEGIVISSRKQGKFSVLVFCSFQPVTEHNSESAIAVKIPHISPRAGALSGSVSENCKHAEKSLAAEIQILHKDVHPHIVPLHGYLKRTDVFPLSLMIMPRMKANLEQILNRSELPLPHRAGLCKGLCSGLEYIHGMKICHRDLKPDNCLVSYGGVLKLCDFGMIRKCNAEGIYLAATDTGAKGYWPPEVQIRDADNKRTYGLKADMFGAGVIMAQTMNLNENSHVRRVLGYRGEIFWVSPLGYISEKGSGFSQVLPAALLKRKLTPEQFMEQGIPYEKLPLNSIYPTADIYLQEEMSCIIASCLREDRTMRPDAAAAHKSITEVLGESGMISPEDSEKQA